VFTPGGNAPPGGRIDPSFDVAGATRQLNQLGYKVVATTPPLNDASRRAIEAMLTTLVGVSGDRKQALELLNNAVKTWKSGKP
jgi:hypothetical protein